ncbi:MAG: PAS domain S-box protein [Ignavibacteria bacterium]|nr:PAS domain S-box protein [Ignavibacteria bacterium]
MKEKITSVLSKNTILTVFLILTVLILGLEFLLYHFERNRLIEEEQSFLTFIANNEEKSLSEWYFKTKTFAEVFIKSETFKNLFQSYIKNPNDFRTNTLLTDLFRKEIVEKNLVTVIIYDTNLNPIYSFQNIPFEIKKTTLEKFYEFDKDNHFYISLIYKTKSPIYENLISVCDVAVGVFNNQNSNKPDYYLVFVYDARKNIFPLINTLSNTKNSLETILLAEEEGEIFYLNDLRFVFSSDITLKANPGKDEITGRKIVISKKGLNEGLDYRGERVFAYTTYIPVLNWYLVTKIDKREVLIQTNKILYTISGSIILILFLFIVVLGVLWKREEVERIKKELEIQKMQNLMAQKYQIVSKYANDAFFLISKDGSIVEANDKAIEMYGYSITELKGRPFVLLEAPENRTEWSDLLNRLRNDVGSVFESLHINRAGNKFYVEISAKIISIQNELFLVAIVRNIEDRKKTELQLIESEKKFYTLFQQAYDSILLLKKDLIIDCNTRASKLFNILKEDLIHKSIKEFIAENDSEILKGFYSAISAPNKAENKSYQLTLKTSDGKIFDGELNLSVFELKGENIIQLVIRDITERKQFLEHLEKFKRAFENTDEMMMITDVNGVIEYVNPAFERITGYTLEEIKGKTPSILKSGLHPEDFYRSLWNTILSGKSWQGIIVNKKKDGTLYTEEMIISPIKNEKNIITSFVAVKKDVTERIKAEEELKLARLKAEESDRIKSNFLSMMSHEVRTPLNVILGFLDIIKSSINEEDFPEKEHIFSVIQRNSKRLITLINDIIDISRIESNEMKLEFGNYNAQMLLMKSIAEFELDARAKGLRIIEDYNLDNALIRVDEIRFQQIMANLLSNAIKFTSRGEITVSAKVIENKLYISVKDTGIGIPKEFLPHLFQFFRQAEEGYNRNFEGAGLGLAITKKLVNMMNGEIYVESELNKGSTFTIVFPVVTGEEEKQETEEASIKFEPVVIEKEEPTVLIVEDNKDNSYFVEVILDKLGLKYFSVSNAEQAFEILKNKQIDLILMDISLSGSMSGEDILKVLKQSNKYQMIPVIAMTAHAMMRDKEYFLSVGFDDYIAKPFTFDQLTQLLFKYLKKENA